MSFPGRHLQKCWHLVDAKDQTVGRLAAQVAAILRGKHKPTFRPNKDMGDYVVIVNADKVRFSNQKKWKNKLYRWHTGYPGGLKERPAHDMIKRRPTYILQRAILGMLSSSAKRLRRGFIEPRLKIYSGPEHPHTAQLPATVEPLPRLPDGHQQAAAPFGTGVAAPYAQPGSYQASFPETNRK